MIISFLKNFIRMFRSDEYGLKVAIANGMLVGEDCRFYSYNFGSEPYLIEIGDHVTISSNVSFITHDGGVWVFRLNEPDIEVTSPIKIGNNVFIGHGVIILPGTTISDNVVVGAGSVVKGHLVSGMVYAGIPAKGISDIASYRQRLRNVEMVKNFCLERKKKFYTRKFKVNDKTN